MGFLVDDFGSFLRIDEGLVEETEFELHPQNVSDAGVEGLFGDAAFEIGTRINAGGGMPLDIHQVAPTRVFRSSEKMVETHVIEARGRGETGNVSAQFAAPFAGA